MQISSDNGCAFLYDLPAMSVISNFGEELAYWYLRLNGFFPINNFVIHRSLEIEHRSDCDILAIRMPHVYEDIGGQPGDWDNELEDALDFQLKIGVICEAKTGDFDRNQLFRDQYIRYSIQRLGILPREQINPVVIQLRDRASIKTDNCQIVKLLVSERREEPNGFIFKSLFDVRRFIENRMRRYLQEKDASRLFFPSLIIQDLIAGIRRETLR